MELRHIRYFLAVLAEMNFTRAAQKLCIAQPPLSRQIQELEEELGVKLFERRPHALRLTEEGMIFKEYATQVINLVNKSTEDIRERNHGLQGTLLPRFGRRTCTTSVCPMDCGFSQEESPCPVQSVEWEFG